MKKYASCFEGMGYFQVTDNQIYLNGSLHFVNRTLIRSLVLEELDRVEIEVDIGEARALSVASINMEKFNIDASISQQNIAV